MKNHLLALTLLSAVLLSTCKKKEDTSAPRLVTFKANEITYNTVRCGGGSILNGPILEKGICWSETRIPDIKDRKAVAGDGDANYTVLVEGLQAGRSYYLRAYATNKYRTGYGEPILVTTSLPPALPQMSTRYTNSVTLNSAVTGGQFLDMGQATINSAGVCWSTHPTPTVEDDKQPVSYNGNASFTTALTSLSPNTLYYVRAYASTPFGEVYGNETTIRTYFGTMTDQNGNVYYTVKIGNKEWMAENLRATSFRDGTSIAVNATGSWSGLNQPVRCDYSPYTVPVAYGLLYNWYCITNAKNIAPSGWHVPDENEWESLVYDIGTPYTANELMKSSDPDFWYNSTGTNQSGFSAIGTGFRSIYQNIEGRGYVANFWVKGSSMKYIFISYSNGYDVEPTNVTYLGMGYSIRCVKD